MALSVSTAVAGLSPSAVTESTTSYTLVDVPAGSRITAGLDSALPFGVTLKVVLQAPAGGTSSGPVALSTTAQDLVRSIPAGSYSGLTITYELSVTARAGVIPSGSHSVIFTVQAGS